jgi:hypothetical protein
VSLHASKHRKGGLVAGGGRLLLVLGLLAIFSRCFWS